MGREIDVLVAEHVMGLDIKLEMGPFGFTFPHYSTDIAAVWEVAERIELFKHFFLEVRAENEWRVLERVFQNDFCHFVTGDTAPMAICLAALKLKEE